MSKFTDMEKTVFISMPIEDLQSLIIDCVNSCLKHNPKQVEQTTPTDQLLTIEEACVLLHLSKPTVYSKVSRNELPVCKPEGSKRIYFSLSDLTDYIKNGRKKTKSEIDNAANFYLTKKR